MTYKTCYWDSVDNVQKERDCTAEEIAEIEARKTAPPPVPKEVSMSQAQEALYNAGLLTTIDAAIAAMPDELGDKARIRWSKSATIRRDSDWLATLAPLLAMTDAQIDDLFIAANKL